MVLKEIMLAACLVYALTPYVAYATRGCNDFGRRYGPNSQIFMLSLYYDGPQKKNVSKKKLVEKKNEIKKRREPYENQ